MTEAPTAHGRPHADLRELAQQLVDARHRLDALRDTLAEFFEEEEPARVRREQLRLETLMRDERQEVEALEQETRAAIVEHTKETGDTEPLPGLSSKTFSEPTYSYPEAFDWCLQNAPGLLSLNAKEFERVAKQRGLPFVHWHMNPRGFIASDLAAKLQDEGWTRADTEREVRREQYKAIEPE